MKKPSTRKLQALIREAFGLLLELRSHPEAHRLLSQAVAFLHLLVRGGDTNTPAMIVSVRVMRLPGG